MATKKQHPNVNVSFRRKELYYMVGALKEQLTKTTSQSATWQESNTCASSWSDWNRLC